MFVPSPASWFCTAAEEPAPTAMRMITAATPIRMPNIVSADRKRFDMMPWNARRTLSIMRALPRAQPRPVRVSLRIIPSRKRTTRFA